VRIDVVTLFPELIVGPLGTSIIGRAADAGLVDFGVHDLREQGIGRHRSVDDYPYGGGAGMVDPAGERLSDPLARELASVPHLALVCGRYEGIDERVRTLVDREVSIGDYVLTGGELPALVLIDAIVRLVPGVIAEASHVGDSFASGLLEHPQYTRPETFRDLAVPPVLLSGHHGEVDRWRRREALRRTLERRADLLQTAEMTDDDRRVLDELRAGDAPPD
jgi:tRNA (guanine37-N1)-methyltransferase